MARERATTQTSLDHFFKRVDRIESNKGAEPVPSSARVRELAACPQPPIAEGPSALPSPPPLSPPPVSYSSYTFTLCQPLYASYYTLFFKVLYCKILNALFSVCFLCIRFNSVAQLCLTLCDPMDCSIPVFPVHHQFPEPTQTHVHHVVDAIQPSHPLSSPSPPTFNLSQHQGLFK